VIFTALPEIDDPLVLLRPVAAGDLLPWAALVQLPEVRQHTSWNIQTPADLSNFVWQPVDHAPASPLRMAVISRASGEFAGTIGFHSVSPENRTAELAYELVPAQWGKGIATRLCRALTSWAHKDAGLVRVQATTLITNERSIRVLERSSFQREGLMRHYRIVRGQPGDFYMYGNIGPRQAA
jgi:[ribosomal protein S5]-alanine N-acetyltransferase